MSKLHHFTPGDYEFLEGGFPYSQGVIASPGFELERVRFARAPVISAGFDRIAKHLHSVGRPLTALCAIELRSPRPFTFSGFHDFNVGYVNTLTQWGLVRDGLNPVGRSNVCPVFDAPSEPVFHAFSYTVPASSSSARDFIVAGSGEWPEGQPFPQAIIARGDVSPAGLAAKVAFVIKTMQERCAGLGGDLHRREFSCVAQQPLRQRRPDRSRLELASVQATHPRTRVRDGCSLAGLRAGTLRLGVTESTPLFVLVGNPGEPQRVGLLQASAWITVHAQAQGRLQTQRTAHGD
jgi:hypothetical protein